MARMAIVATSTRVQPMIDAYWVSEPRRRLLRPEPSNFSIRTNGNLSTQLGTRKRPRGGFVTEQTGKCGGPSRNRTGVRGFAVPYVTTPPSGPATCRGPWRRRGQRVKAHFRRTVALRAWRSRLPAIHCFLTALYYQSMTVADERGTPMDHNAARRAMVDNQLRPEGVTDAAVLAAMGSVAREDHVPEGARAFAYFDRPIALGDGRAMMPPAALGRLLSALAPAPASVRSWSARPAAIVPPCLPRPGST